METHSDRSLYQLVAAEKFPYSAQNVRGDGKYALISKCGRRWRILLYQTEELRAAREDQWFDNGCGPDCRSDHFKFDLSL